MSGRRVRDSVHALKDELFLRSARATVEFAPIKPLTETSVRSARSRAFLLFLAQLPRNAAAQQRRQERLGMSDTRAARSLFGMAVRVKPGNHVIADLSELRALRVAIQGGQGLPAEMADEFAIPEEAVRALPSRRAFLEIRGKWLAEQEKVFIESFGLTVSDSE
jgi:hypothetical protein